MKKQQDMEAIRMEWRAVIEKRRSLGQGSGELYSVARQLFPDWAPRNKAKFLALLLEEGVLEAELTTEALSAPSTWVNLRHGLDCPMSIFVRGLDMWDSWDGDVDGFQEWWKERGGTLARLTNDVGEGSGPGRAPTYREWRAKKVLEDPSAAEVLGSPDGLSYTEAAAETISKVCRKLDDEIAASRPISPPRERGWMLDEIRVVVEKGEPVYGVLDDQVGNIARTFPDWKPTPNQGRAFLLALAGFPQLARRVFFKDPCPSVPNTELGVAIALLCETTKPNLDGDKTCPMSELVREHPLWEGDAEKFVEAWNRLIWDGPRAVRSFGQEELRGPLGEDAKDTNPKDAVGIRKPPLSTVSSLVMQEIGVAMAEGARKYGRHNYRVVGVRASVYYDATLRHLMSWFEGEDVDPGSGLSHVTKALASLIVLRDAMICGKLTDDRPPSAPVGEVRERLETVMAELFERIPECKEAFVRGDG